MYKELVRRNVIILAVAMMVFFVLTLFITTYVNRNNTEKQLLYVSDVVSNALVEQTHSDEDVRAVVSTLTKEQNYIAVAVANSYGAVIANSEDDSSVEGGNATLTAEELQLLGGEQDDRFYINGGKMYYIVHVTDGRSYDMILRTSVAMLDNTAFITASMFVLALMLIVVIVVSIALTGKTSKTVTDAFSNVTAHLQSISANGYTEIETEHRYEEVSEAYREINAVNVSIVDYIRRLSDEKNKVNYIVDNIGEGIVIVGMSGELYTVNDYAKSVFGITNIENDVKYYYKDVITKSKFVSLIEEEMSCKKSIGCDVYDDETDKIYYVTLNCFKQASIGGEDLVSMVLYDVTEKRRDEQNKADFVANASHELKTPITSISGFSELLMSGLVTNDEDRQNYIKKIYDSAISMKHTVEELLYLSKLDYSDSLKEIESVDLLEVCNVVKEKFDESAKEKNVSVNVEGQQLSVNGSSALLEHLIGNLVDNAIKYNKDGGTVTVEVGRKRRVFVKVIDTGYGIEKQNLDKLFERFYRIDNSRSRSTGGTGLGLTIAQRICNLHNAEISVKSTVGKGTTFTVRFNNSRED